MKEGDTFIGCSIINVNEHVIPKQYTLRSPKGKIFYLTQYQIDHKVGIVNPDTYEDDHPQYHSLFS